MLPINKAKLFVYYAVVKVSIFALDRKDDFHTVYVLAAKKNYLASLEELLMLTKDSIEYIVTINF